MHDDLLHRIRRMVMISDAVSSLSASYRPRSSFFVIGITKFVLEINFLPLISSRPLINRSPFEQIRPQSFKIFKHLNTCFMGQKANVIVIIGAEVELNWAPTHQVWVSALGVKKTEKNLLNFYQHAAPINYNFPTSSGYWKWKSQRQLLERGKISAQTHTKRPSPITLLACKMRNNKQFKFHFMIFCEIISTYMHVKYRLRGKGFNVIVLCLHVSKWMK